MIRSAGPGRHGDIDYPMGDCRLTQLMRHQPPAGPSRSDHDVITFEARLEGEPDALVIGTWNLLRDRDPRQVRVQVDHVLRTYEVDVLACQESAQYHAALASLPGYRLVAFEGRGREHNVLLVRERLQVRRPRATRLSPRGWRVVTGGRHAPLYATSCVVSWLRVVCVHQPPSVNWRRGVIQGPPMRVAAYAAASSRLARWARAAQRSRRP